MPKQIDNLILKRAREIERIMNFALNDIALSIKAFTVRNPSSTGNFFRFNKLLESKIKETLRTLRSDMLAHIKSGSIDAWTLANIQNDALVASFTKGIDVPKGLMTSMLNPNLNALSTFLSRKEYGLKLSKRVWNITAQTFNNIETQLGAGILQGKSAAKIATQLKKNLRHPDKLFRRVARTSIDAEGNITKRFVLSRAAKAFHPGRGVYRSSYQNAKRLAADTINRTFRASDIERREQLPFVTGIRVNLSAAHPREDICDSLEGLYPKDYWFTGWHTLCICFTTTETLNNEDFKQFIKTHEVPEDKYRDTIPKKAQNYIKDHKEQIEGWKTQPDWYTDNDKYLEDVK